MRYRGKGMQTSLVKEGEHHGLHNIILVMGIGNLIAAQILYGVIQSAFTHFGTERTGIIFPAVFKHDFGDRSLYYGVRNLMGGTECPDLVQIQILKSQIHGYGINAELLRIKFS